jgi:phosphatidylinositol alpha 1,6-mannosyltransferase
MASNTHRARPEPVSREAEPFSTSSPGAPRVAFMPDCYEEVNGLALTSRALHRFARSRGLPLLCVRATARRPAPGHGERMATPPAPPLLGDELVLPRSRLAIALETDLSYDLLFWRHVRRILRALRAFRPDVVHVTGVNDVGQVGAWAAWRLGVPLVASWHTNVHEYAARRASGRLALLPPRARIAVAARIEAGVLRAVARFYALARAILAPNEDLVRLLARRTGKPAFLMQRGVDTDRFSPARRTARDDVFRIGYVGRLSPEKNVRLLPAIQAALGATPRPFRLVVVGDGSEREWLAGQLPGAELPGVLAGEALSAAYADFDVFVFPSATDTFGNVVLEAYASGVPVIVTSQGGPRWLVEEGVTGFVADDARAMAGAVRALMDDPARHAAMRRAARERALATSWARVFEDVWDVYAGVTGACSTGVRAGDVLEPAVRAL